MFTYVTVSNVGSTPGSTPRHTSVPLRITVLVFIPECLVPVLLPPCDEVKEGLSNIQEESFMIG